MLAEADPFRVTFGDFDTGINEEINQSILSCKVSYSTKLCTEISLEIFDTGFKFGANNYFNIGRDVTYVTKGLNNAEDVGGGTAKFTFIVLKMEVADISVSQSQGINPIWTIKCRTKAIQQMKRDKKPGSFPQATGFEFVHQAATKYGLEFVGEKTSKVQRVTQASGTKQADSLWSVITSLANDAHFECFEADGVLYFASMKWLLHRWGSHGIVLDKTKTDPVTKVKTTRKVERRFVPLIPGRMGEDFPLMQLPEMQKGDNDPMEASGSANIGRASGQVLRPGMTVFVGGIPTFIGYYLITAVDFDELSPDPVSISFTTPERNPKDIIQTLPIGKTFPATDDPLGPDVLLPFLAYRQVGAETSAPWSISGTGKGKDKL